MERGFKRVAGTGGRKRATGRECGKQGLGWGKGG